MFPAYSEGWKSKIVIAGGMQGGINFFKLVVASPDGSELIRAETEGPVSDAEGLGQALGGELLDRGARRILEAVYST